MTEYDQRINISAEQRTALEAAVLLCYNKAREIKSRINDTLETPLDAVRELILLGKPDAAHSYFEDFIKKFMEEDKDSWKIQELLDLCNLVCDVIIYSKSWCFSANIANQVRDVKEHFDNEDAKGMLENAAKIIENAGKKSKRSFSLVETTKETSEDDTAHNES